MKFPSIRSFSHTQSALANYGSQSILPPLNTLASKLQIKKFASTCNLRTPRSLGSYKLAPITSSPINSIPKLQNSLTASGSSGLIKSYAANSHVGLVRKSNEDRVTINYRVAKPVGKVIDDWPLVSYFAVFDGHGGSLCADFLRDNLLEFIIKQKSFPASPGEAIKQGFAEAEAAFLDFVERKISEYDHSGSCANVVIIVDGVCFVANVGDSRAVMSVERGSRFHELSRDHKPNLETERARVESVGGKVYSCGAASISANPSAETDPIYRVMPGRLAISRTFGDADAKLECYGGIKGAIIAEPEIKSFRISRKYDFILIASDGVFDKLSSSEAIKTAWSAIESSNPTFHGACGEAVKQVIKAALMQQTFDNVTVVLVAFKSFRDVYSEHLLRSK